MHPFDWQKMILRLTIIFVSIGISFSLSKCNSDMEIVYVPEHDFPAYHLIQEIDLVDIAISVSDLDQDVVNDKDDLINKYTLKEITAKQAVKNSQIISSSSVDLVTDTVPLSISATAAMTYNGKLSSGMIVTLWSIPIEDNPEERNAIILIPQVLVLDVMTTQNSDGITDQPYIIILAVPIAHREEVLTSEATGSLILSLVP